MNAKIDIKTPAGQSLEGFPKEIPFDAAQFFVTSSEEVHVIDWTRCDCSNDKVGLKLHKGDIITIEIL